MHLPHRAKQSESSDVNSTTYETHERLLEEVGESSTRFIAVVRFLQLQPFSHDSENRNASDGHRACRSRLDDPCADRGIGQVLKLRSKPNGPSDKLGLVRSKGFVMQAEFKLATALCGLLIAYIYPVVAVCRG